MTRIVFITQHPVSPAHGALASAALARASEARGHTVELENEGGPRLSPESIRAADLVVVAHDHPVDLARFAGKPVHETGTSQAIVDTFAVLEAALGLLGMAKPAPAPAPVVAPVVARKLVAVTACPTGIAHTFMAARALEKAAQGFGHVIKVETQGSVGAKNVLDAADIAAADAVLVAADTKVDLTRFAGKRLLQMGTKEALHGGAQAITRALEAPVFTPSAVHAAQPASGRGSYKHLMTGVSHMLPLVTAGGLAMALAFAFGGIHPEASPGSLSAALAQVGSTALSLFVAVLSGFIATSIADRPGLAPGLVGGMLAQALGTGFLGGIAAGFLAGHLTRLLSDKLPLPTHLEGLKPVLILPFVATLALGLAMLFVIAPPLQALNQGLNAQLTGLQGESALALGLLLGGMVAFDLGGPVNQAAYTFAVGLIATQLYAPMAAVMAAGMTPAIGAALAVFVRPGSFDADERRAAGPALVLGLSFITEGAIPFAARDPLRVLPAFVVGSALTGAISMASGITLLVPHGGIFAALIPGAVSAFGTYLLAIAIGSVSTAALLLVLRKRADKPLPLAAT